MVVQISCLKIHHQIKRRKIRLKKLFIKQRKILRQRIRLKRLQNKTLIYLTSNLYLFLKTQDLMQQSSLYRLNSKETAIHRLSSSHVSNVHQLQMNKFSINFSFKKVLWLTIGVPFFGLLFCISWSLIYNFNETTYTDCKVYNFLPSVSAAIGRWEPQKLVWKGSITIQATFRTIILYIYYYHCHEEKFIEGSWGIRVYVLLSYFLENVALITVSFCSSVINYGLHILAFTIFLIMSVLHMLLSYKITKNRKNISNIPNHIKSIKWKFNSMVVNFVSVIMAVYLFYRHNKYCEPYVYSVFSLVEYVLVFSNMAFHASMAYDFDERSYILSLKGLKIE